jgi:hypothetical protein
MGDNSPAPQKGQAWRCYVGGERCKAVGKVILSADAVIAVEGGVGRAAADSWRAGSDSA